MVYNSRGGHSHRLCSHISDRRRSMVKATQKAVVSGQSMLRNAVNADNGKPQCGMDGHVRKSNSAACQSRAFQSIRIEQQAVWKVTRTINS